MTNEASRLNWGGVSKANNSNNEKDDNDNSNKNKLRSRERKMGNVVTCDAKNVILIFVFHKLNSYIALTFNIINE